MAEVHCTDKNFLTDSCENKIMKNHTPSKYNLLKSRLIFLITIMTMSLLIHKPAAAQRGLETADTQEINSPSSGVAGFYDTNTAQEKSLSFDFPTLNIDYGITPKLTIGTNILTALSTLHNLSESSKRKFKFFNGKIRYRIFSVQNWSAAFTNYLVYVRGYAPNALDPNQSDQYTFLTAAALNIANTLPQGTWGFSFFAAIRSDTIGAQNSGARSESEQGAKMYTLWWRQKLTDSFEGELLASLCPNIQEKTINSMMRVDGESSCLGTRKYDPVVRSMMNWRSSNEWLWSGGLIWFPGSEIINYLPFVAFNYRTPMQFTSANEELKRE